MTCTIGRTPVRIHVVLSVLWGAMLLFQGPALLLPTLAALMLHETGHLAAAKALGARVEEIEITPFGGVIALANEETLAPMRGFLLAAAGPVCSLLGCFLSLRIYRAGYLSFFAARRFAQYNLLLTLLNLLPVLPLDGGRMIRHLLCRRLPYRTVTRLLLLLGVLMGGSISPLPSPGVIFAMLPPWKRARDCRTISRPSLQGGRKSKRTASCRWRSSPQAAIPLRKCCCGA